MHAPPSLAGRPVVGLPTGITNSIERPWLSPMQRSFKREIRSLNEIFSFLDGLMESHQTDPAPAYVIRFAVEELFTNMVKYNRSGDPEIVLGFETDSRSCVVTLVDCGGEPFDVTQAVDVDTSMPLEDRPVGGLGIHLVRQLVDDLRYVHSGRCGIITIVKNLEEPYVRDHRQG
jgi:serine/threonine-protein kinase RsbW